MEPSTEFIWAIGLFEGEGCIHINKEGRAQLSLSSTDKDVVDDFARIVACGSVTKKKKRQNHHKQCYNWQLQSQYPIHCLLKVMYPFLHARRRNKAGEVLSSLNPPAPLAVGPE